MRSSDLDLKGLPKSTVALLGRCCNVWEVRLSRRKLAYCRHASKRDIGTSLRLLSSFYFPATMRQADLPTTHVSSWTKKNVAKKPQVKASKTIIKANLPNIDKDTKRWKDFSCSYIRVQLILNLQIQYNPH